MGPDGRLVLDGLSLAVLARELEGRAAWVFGRRAFDGPLGVVSCAPVTDLGPPELLALAAAAGWWAEVSSAHELRVALQAGFDPPWLRAVGAVKEDGFVKDALAAPVAVLRTDDDHDAANVQRIASVLGCAVPPSEGGPARCAPEAFGGTGGLLAPVLRAGPHVQVDGLLPRGGALDVFPLVPGEPIDGTVEGLSAGDSAPRVARVHGRLSRGDWVFVPEPTAATARSPDLTHPEPVAVLVRDGRWRELTSRPLPEAPGTAG